MLSAGIGTYFVSRKIFGFSAVFVIMIITLAVVSMSVRYRLAIIVGGYIALQMILCVLCFMHEAMMPGRPSRRQKRKRRAGNDSDEEDEYISIAPTMTVREIVKAYTRDPQEAEAKYTDKPMNVTGLITRITTGGTYSHVELDEKFICICPQGSVSKLKPLQKVCITGILRGKYLLDNCVMVKH